MVDISNFAADPTLEAVDRAVENANQARPKKAPYMGASSIGEHCERKVWLNWRMAKQEVFTAEQLYRFDDGFHTESVMANRLAMAGIKVKAVDPNTGYQFAISAVDSHLRGRIDGLIEGLIQSPKTLHVWECKAANEKKVAELVKAKAEHGEKNALKAWDSTYYAQACLYMHFMDVTRHYLTVSSPGARTTVSVRTNADTEYAKMLIEKATRVKNAQDLPEGISTDATSFKCKMCNFYELCHQNKVASVNCRTCAHASPVADGEWHCEKYNRNVPQNFQVTGCDKHLFTPSLIQFAKPVDASVEDNWIEYQRGDGRTFRNGQGIGCYTSKELSAVEDVNAIGDASVDKIKSVFGAEVVL